MEVVREHGGAVEAVPYMKSALVDSHRERLRRIESGKLVVVGQNRFTETEDSPLTADAEGGILVVDPAVEAGRVEAVRAWRAERDQAAVDAALSELARVADSDENLMASHDRGRAGRRDHGRVGRRAARGVRQLPRAHRRGSGGDRSRVAISESCATRSRGWARSSDAAPRSSWASRVWTVTPTAPSRSRCAPATPAWTSCMRASG